MRISQLIFIALIINFLNFFIGIALQSTTIETMEDLLPNWFDGGKGEIGWFNKLTSSFAVMQKNDMWMIKFAGEVLQGLANSLNTVVIMVQVIGLIISAWILPTYNTISATSAEGITILRLIGMISLLYLHWFNILLVTRLIGFIRGSSD